MSRSPPHPIPLLSVGSQDTPAPRPPLLPPLQDPSSRSWAFWCGPSTWGLSCLLALQVGGEGGRDWHYLKWRESASHEKPTDGYFESSSLSIPLSPAFPGLYISALGLPPAAASQSSPGRALIPTCSAPGFQFFLMWHVYGPADLDGQQVRGTPLREGVVSQKAT